MTVKRLTGLMLVLACLGPVATANAVEPQSEYKIKSAYLYNFSKFTHLPESHFRENDGYDLCIVGHSPFGNFLETLSGRDVEGHALTLHYLNNKRPANACEMLFISRSKAGQLDQLLSQAAENKILTISDIDGFASRGGMIGLVIKENRIRFQINQAVAQSCGISISSKLLELGEIVTTRGDKERSRCSE